MAEARAELFEHGRLRLLGGGQRVQLRPQRRVRPDGAQQRRRWVRRGAAEDVDEHRLAVALVREAALADEDPPRRRGVGEQDRVPQEQVQQRVQPLCREARGQALAEDVVEARSAEEVDVVLAQRSAGRLGSTRDERAAEADRAVGRDDLEEALLREEPGPERRATRPRRSWA